MVIDSRMPPQQATIFSVAVPNHLLTIPQYIEGLFADSMPTARPEGGKMHNLKDFEQDIHLLLDGVGGEPLAGSGFEDEAPEPGFAAPDFSEGH